MTPQRCRAVRPAMSGRAERKFASVFARDAITTVAVVTAFAKITAGPTELMKSTSPAMSDCRRRRAWGETRSGPVPAREDSHLQRRRRGATRRDVRRRFTFCTFGSTLCGKVDRGPIRFWQP